MGMNNDPDESDLLDLGLARMRLRQRLAADGVFCRDDAAAMAAWETPLAGLSERHRIRRAMETLLACGVTRRSGAKAREAGLTVVVSEDLRVRDVLRAHDPEQQQAA